MRAGGHYPLFIIIIAACHPTNLTNTSCLTKPQYPICTKPQLQLHMTLHTTTKLDMYAYICRHKIKKQCAHTSIYKIRSVQLRVTELRESENNEDKERQRY